MISPRQLRRVGQGAPAEDLGGHGSEEHLLAPDTREVALGQAVALADERQRVRAGDRPRPGGEPRTGQHVIDRGLEAHVDPADRAGQVVEAEQVHLGEVVHRDPGELLHRPDQGDAARPRGLRVDPGAVLHALADQPLGRQRRHRRVRSIDLVGAEAGYVDVGVARDREGDGRAAVLRNMQQDDRVGVQHARVVAAGVQLLQHLLRQRVALGVGPAVDTDQQDVQPPAVPATGDDVGGGDARGHVPVEPPRHTGEHEDQRGGDGGRDAQPVQPAV